MILVIRSMILFAAFFLIFTGCETRNREGDVKRGDTADVKDSTVDPLQVSPDIYRTLLENEYVRMIENSAKPGKKDYMHSHPDSVRFVLEGEKLRISTPDGLIRTVEIRPGDVHFQKPVDMHATENIGDAALKLLIVELKKRIPAGTPGPDPVKVSPGIYRVLAENDKFRVLDVSLSPGEKDEPHGHPSSLYYVLSDAAGIRYSEGKGPEEFYLWAGDASFQRPVQKHQMENSGSTDIRLILFELKPG